MVDALKKNTAIVLLNWNGKDWLSRFLPNLVRYSEGCHIILADNCSTDTSVAYVRSHYPTIEIIQNKQNGGFAKGYNDALNELKGRFDYYALVNTDIEVTEGWIETLLNELVKDKSIGGIQPKIRSFHEREKFEYAGAAGGFLDKTYYPFCRGRIFDHLEVDNGQYDQDTTVFWVSGACFLIRSELFHELNGFDEQFFAHMEEIDLCWRAQKLGYRFKAVSKAMVYHVGGGTLAYGNPKKTFLNFRNSLMMIHKNHNGFLAGMIFKRLCLDGMAGVKFLFSGEFSHFKAVLKAHFSYYRHVSELNKKRKVIIQKQISTELIGKYKKCIIWTYYFRRIRAFSKLKW